MNNATARKLVLDTAARIMTPAPEFITLEEARLRFARATLAQQSHAEETERYPAWAQRHGFSAEWIANYLAQMTIARDVLAFERMAAETDYLKVNDAFEKAD